MLLPVCNHDHTGTVVHNIEMYIIHIVHQLLKQHFMRGCGIGQGLYTLGISTGREAWAWFKANGGAHGVLFGVLPYWAEGGVEPVPEHGSG